MTKSTFLHNAHKATVCKVHEDLGLVFGWAIISEIGGEPYFDLQGDHIPEEAMLKASTEFMDTSRVAGEMHEGPEGGSIVHAWPMTKDIAAAFGIQTEITGLMIAMRPKNEETLEKFRDGTYSGFSIGGFRGEDEEVDDDA